MTKTITPTPRRMKNNHTILLFALLLLVSTKMAVVEAFVIPGGVKIIQHGTSEICGIDLMRRTTRTTKLPKTFSSSYLFHLRSVQQDQQQDQEQETSNDNATTEYERLLLEATKMRLEAEKMDIDLTLKKITILEDKLSNDVWLKKQNGQTVKDLYEQLRRLQMKIDGDFDTNGSPSPLVTIGNKKQNDDETSSSLSSTSSSSSISTTSINDDVKDNPNNDLANGSKGDDDIVVVEKEKKYSSSSSSSSNNNRNVPPIAGFDNEDLKLYVPVAEDVNRMAPDSSLEERMVLFRDAPELQAHFKEKIQKLLLGPLEEMQELENYKQQYFDSSSSREREALLKQIKRLEKKQEDNNISIGSGDDAASIAANNDNNSGFGFSDKIYIPPEDLPILLDGELEERYETIKALPDILVAVYLQRNGLYNLPVALNTINVDIGRGGIGFNMSIANKTSTTTTSTSENDDKDEDEVNKKLNEVDTVGEDQSTTTTAVSDNTNTDTSSFDLTTAAVSDNDTDASSSFDLYENLKLAIQLDYYDLQIQLLDQARDIQPMTDELRMDFSLAFRSLPVDVRKRFVVNNLRIDKFTDSVLTSNEDNDIEEILNEILKPDDIISPFMQFGSLFDQKAKKNVLVVGNGDEGGGQIQPERPEYNDVEFVDRSRYLEEFFPSVALLEDQRPTQEDVDIFVTECLSKPFMVTSKPERVIGGYYIRGTNQVLNNNKNKDTTTTPTDMLVQEVYKRLQNQPSIKDKIEFYYILDPSPPTDEEMELEVDSNPVFLVTTKDPDTMYNLSLPWTKSIVTISGLVSTFLFSVGSCVLNPKINDGIEKALDNASTSGFIDIQWFYDLCLPLYFSLLGILFAHELGHRIAASIHKVNYLLFTQDKKTRENNILKFEQKTHLQPFFSFSVVQIVRDRTTKRNPISHYRYRRCNYTDQIPAP
jgi:hypothetical protein